MKECEYFENWDLVKKCIEVWKVMDLLLAYITVNINSISKKEK